ncbi:MAG: universal stress protein [Carnobacterium sp.]|uniref:Universal stress protein n=1 Tax=Carnobacterium antarcticum TaxID=2126436 RepID=A0ABW4NP95_9LACT|nr:MULTISPECIES: universal stress protein [unclassified Carnobacterium]ALV20649.1 Universal stress protein [Carnobacterium sp. CP1]ALV23011.1 Universal stress protein [Carnobacterium sp. CP1]QQP70883.1 universal stress protein [Carnobacterium sp. CS13]
MLQDTQQYAHILVAVDGSDSAKEAFEQAVEIAKRNHSELVIAHVIDTRSYNMGIESASFDVLEFDLTEMEKLLKEYGDKAKAAGLDKVTTELVKGSPKIELAKDIPERHRSDLIVVGKTGLNMVERWMIGSVSEYIIRQAPCDVLVIRNTEKG